MDELDDEQHMPEGVESAVWQRLVQARRQKVESEQQVKINYIYSREGAASNTAIRLVGNIQGIFLSLTTSR